MVAWAIAIADLGDHLVYKIQNTKYIPWDPVRPVPSITAPHSRQGPPVMPKPPSPDGEAQMPYELHLPQY